jgi:hypothetical protein
MRNSSLVAINLRANYIGDKGAAALADSASKSTSLRFLVLAANDLTRSGEVRALRAVKFDPPCTLLARRVRLTRTRVLSDFLNRGRTPCSEHYGRIRGFDWICHMVKTITCLLKSAVPLLSTNSAPLYLG